MRSLFRTLPATTPHRSSLMRRGVVLCVLGGLVALCSGGCSVLPPARLFPVATPIPSVRKRAQDAARLRSVTDALSKIDSKTITAWIDRWSAAGALNRGNGTSAVRINAETLAHHHPAWILADALEKGAVSPTSPVVARVLAVSGPGAPVVRPIGVATASINTVPATTVYENFDNAAARARQSAAQESFFASAAARDALRGRDEAFLARRALEDSIAASQRGAVADLDLSLIPADVALELTNLRLQLLRSLSRTPAQRAQSRAEIAAIEDRFAEIWRQQTALQADRLRDVTIDVPAQQRQEGLARIEHDSQVEAEKRATARGNLAEEAKSPLDGDFEPKHTQLHLALPASRKVGAVEARRNESDSQLIETTSPVSPSRTIQNNQPLSSPVKGSPKAVAALRSKARREASEWASLVAAQMGSRWNNSAANPDRTAAAIAILFPNYRG